MERGRKNRTNIRKQVVRNPAMLNQTIRRRVLFTGGSGTDSTTTDGAFATVFAGAFGAGGAEAVAGGAATAELSSLKLLSTAENLPPLTIDFQAVQRSHVNAGDCVEKYTIPRDTGIDVSAKTKVSLFTKSAAHLKKVINWPSRRLLYNFRSRVGKQIVRVARASCM
jgi:hypothetical protein